MISVVIPLYNKEAQIANTLQTILNQTYQNFEIVIVNDGSTDNSIAEVNKIKDNRIRVINQKNAGVSAARNRGIEEAKYNLIAFLDADDEWKEEYLETQYKLYLKYPECSVFATNYEFKDSKGKITHTVINKLPFGGDDGILNNYFEVASCSHPPICSISVMVIKDAIMKIGGFPLGIKSGEDLLTWAKLAVNYKIAYTINSYAYYSRLSGNAIQLSAYIRKPEEPDIVGNELKKILKGKDRFYYLPLWYKNRANLYFRSGNRYMVAVYAFKAIRYNIFYYKSYAYLLFSVLPKSIVSKFIGR